MSVHRALAPAKVNLGLFVGPVRPRDERHELVTVMQSISLADELTLEPAPAGTVCDEVLCPGVAGEPRDNLAAAALRAFRDATGWDGPPQRLHIRKRIPVAAGMGGGSADAAATLRLAVHASGLGDHELLLALAAQLGADVPAQVAPGRWLAGGAGEELEELVPPREGLAVLVLPLSGALSTAAVYEEADRLGRSRSASELAALRDRLAAALGDGAAHPGAELLHNDLQPAALALCPQIADALALARSEGAEIAFVSGSGPTVVGLFPHRPAERGAPAGASGGDAPGPTLHARVPAAIWATPVDAAFGLPDGCIRHNDAQSS